ncbi:MULTISPECIES: PASTA domain-containing protein [unclassified Kribbella]|uniref:PASTA domain-containing protein n=1 Tax=unclassified Kribbella TaxID=2644121 RepID=UPI0034107735
MNESKLTDLLDRAAERTTVGPPPIDAMHAHATRARRRRTLAVCVTAAVAVAAAGGATALLTSPTSSVTPPPVASTSPHVAPADTRLVGVGHAAIAVPAEWGTNKERCGTPTADTVMFDVGAVHLCLSPRPAGVESVWILDGKTRFFKFVADETFQLDGVRAERQRTSCVSESFKKVTVCSGAVYLPSLDVKFYAQSSTNAAEVDRILDRVTIVPDRVGVPPFRYLEPGNGLSAAKYAEALRALGLKPDIQTRKWPSYTPGELMRVMPEAGTMVPLGSTVTMIVVAP